MLRYLYKAAWYSFGLLWNIYLSMLIILFPRIMVQMRYEVFWSWAWAIAIVLFSVGWLIFLLWFGLRWWLGLSGTAITRLPWTQASPARQAGAITVLSSIQLTVYVLSDLRGIVSSWRPFIDLSTPWLLLSWMMVYLLIFWLLHYLLLSGWRRIRTG